MKSEIRKHHSPEVQGKPWRPLFELGAVVATPAALDLLDRTGMNSNTYILRHQCGDFGTVCAEDAAENVAAIKHGSRILSSYTISGERLWVITEADRTNTTLLLPEEY
jgi:hypothetical protein